MGQEEHPFFGQPKEEMENEGFNGDFKQMHNKFMDRVRHFVEEFKKRTSE